MLILFYNKNNNFQFKFQNLYHNFSSYLFTYLKFWVIFLGYYCVEILNYILDYVMFVWYLNLE